VNIWRKIKNTVRQSFQWTGDLTESPWTRIAHIEFTSRCNLRCVFCAVCRPGYQGRDLDPKILKDITTSLKKRHPRSVNVNGHGETTIYKNWNHYCDDMLEAGMPLHVISNFAKRFSDEEIDTLSRFESIEISCDTNDPELFKQIRRGANLEMVHHNIIAVLKHAEAQNRRLPRISLSCVVSDKNIFKLEPLAVLGKELGVDMFNFCNLTRYPDLEGALNPNHISEMPPALLPRAQDSLTSVFDYLKGQGIKYQVQEGLLDSLQRKLSEIAQPPQEVEPVKDISTSQETGEETSESRAHPLAAHRYAVSPQDVCSQKQTRNCLDPWEFIFIRANQEINPCCWHRSLYTLSAHQSLDDVYNNRPFRNLRRQLLTGELPPDCLNCPSRGWTTVEHLRDRVLGYLSFHPLVYKFRALLHGPIGVQPEDFVWTAPEYVEGWYDEETDDSQKDRDWQTWHWIGKKAVCRLENPQKKAILVIRGAVNRERLPDQQITIQMNDQMIDQFIPQESQFYKEYVISPEIAGKSDKLSLVIETDQVFLPSAVIPESQDHRELGLQVFQLAIGNRKIGR